MNEVCMVPWRLLDSRSEQLPRGVSSRAGAFIWEIPVAGCGGLNLGAAGSSQLSSAAVAACGEGPCPFPHSWSGEQMDGRALPTPWEGTRDLPTAPDAWLLPLPAVEWAGSSKITKTGSCWELGLTTGLMEPATRQIWKWHRVKGCRKQCSMTSGQPCVLWAALHPHVFVSLSEWCSGVVPGYSSTPVQLGGGIEITGYGCKMETHRQSVCDVLSTSKHLPSASSYDIE